MKKSNNPPTGQPTRHQFNVFGQLFKLIPVPLINTAAAESKVDVKARTFSVRSHLASMIFVQLAHALSLNDVCDWLRLKARAIQALGITPPSRNNLSHANKSRSAQFAEKSSGAL